MEKFKFSTFVITHSIALRAGEGDDTNDDSKGDQESQQKDDQESDKKDSKENKDGKESYTRAEMEAVRSEAAKHRTALKTTQTEMKKIQDELKTLKDKDLSESEKLQNRLKELEDSNRALSQKSLRADGVAAAVRNGAIDPDVVSRLIDPDSSDSVDAQVKSLVKEKPFLFKSLGNGDGGKGRGNNNTDGKNKTMNDLIRGNR